jgi:hypothetical protein
LLFQTNYVQSKNCPICVCFLMVPILEKGMVMATAMVKQSKEKCGTRIYLKKQKDDLF